jgi:hypothetical protein
MIERYHLASSLFGEDDVWNQDRLHAFFAYSETWGHYGRDTTLFGTTTKDMDRKFVRKVRSHRTQPSILRAEALWLSGWMIFSSYEQRHLWDKAQDFFNEAVMVCNTISEEDQEKMIPIVDDFVKVRERIKTIKHACKLFDHLQTRFHFGAWNPLTGEDMECKVVGGLECDYCHKSRRELGLDTFKVCSRCNIAYYCTRECQEKAWSEGGHKKLCRKPGEFKSGDGAYITKEVELLRMEDDSSKMEWHTDEQGQQVLTPEVIKTLPVGSIVTIVTRLKETGEMLIEDRHEDDGFATVDIKNLRRCRPDSWQAFTTDDLEYIRQECIARDNQVSNFDDLDNWENEEEELPELHERRHPTQGEEDDDDDYNDEKSGE